MFKTWINALCTLTGLIDEPSEPLQPGDFFPSASKPIETARERIQLALIELKHPDLSVSKNALNVLIQEMHDPFQLMVFNAQAHLIDLIDLLNRTHDEDLRSNIVTLLTRLVHNRFNAFLITRSQYVMHSLYAAREHPHLALEIQRLFKQIHAHFEDPENPIKENIIYYNYAS